MDDLDALAGSLAETSDADAFAHIWLLLGGDDKPVSASWASMDRLRASEVKDDEPN